MISKIKKKTNNKRSAIRCVSDMNINLMHVTITNTETYETNQSYYES